MTDVVVATRNAKKRLEIVDLLSRFPELRVLSLADFPDAPEVEETGATFAENAALKASTVARALGRWTIGEDSGLTVDALGGAPGVYSARYSGPGADDDANNAKLLRELAGVPDPRRTACYVCSAALADPTGAIRLTEEARCRGMIIHEPRGTNGFGYDPYFLVREYHQTFGELPLVVKQQISHRARALERFLPAVVRLLSDVAAG